MCSSLSLDGHIHDDGILKGPANCATCTSIDASYIRGCYFSSDPDGHLAPSYAISRLGPRAAASNCGRRHGGYRGWRGGENSRRGLVGQIISPLWLGRVRVMGRVRVRIGLNRCGVWVRFIG